MTISIHPILIGSRAFDQNTSGKYDANYSGRSMNMGANINVCTESKSNKEGTSWIEALYTGRRNSFPMIYWCTEFWRRL